ncbi:E3 ubiquitin-protein ligase Midline-1-like [Lytechinus pictus]|uniref:E3 ubiquitin-protein ligase Midline-1-like n=1 Tax=Lytechinus pictus TaxID=7653 RepID=UPI0030BA2AD4
MAMAAPLDVIGSLRKEFECSVCMDTLRNARCLFCQHTFCFDCLESCVMSGREAANVISCPVCRDVTRLPREGVAGLKGNALINSLLEKLDVWDKTKNHGPDASGDSKGQEANRCQNCKKLKLDATYFCHHCKEHLCLECVQSPKHHSHHRTVSGPDADQNCEVHCWVPAKFYCIQCDKLCCRLCSHDRKTTIPLHRKASSVQVLMQELIDQCSNESIAIQTTHHEVNMIRENATEALQKLMAEVRQKAETVISKVEDKKEELLAYLGAVMGRMEEEMEEKQNKCSNLEESLQAVVTEWQTLQESLSDALVVKKQGSIANKMKDLLKAIDSQPLTPSSALSDALNDYGLQFIPSKLYLDALCNSSTLGRFEVVPHWVSHRYDETYESISQLMFLDDGKMLIADTWNGIKDIPPLEDELLQDGPNLVHGDVVRDLTVVAGSTIVYQNNKKEIFKIVGESSVLLHGFNGKWVSVTSCPSDGQDLIVVADQNFHDQCIMFMDIEGNLVSSLTASYVGGVRFLRFDKFQNAIFIDHDRQGVHSQRLRDDGMQNFVIAEENTLYLALACHKSDFLYVASQKASRPNVVTVNKHSLEDGSLLETLVTEFVVHNSFRMVMANLKDKAVAVVVGSSVALLLAGSGENTRAVLQLE